MSYRLYTDSSAQQDFVLLRLPLTMSGCPTGSLSDKVPIVWRRCVSSLPDRAYRSR